MLLQLLLCAMHPAFILKWRIKVAKHKNAAPLFQCPFCLKKPRAKNAHEASTGSPSIQPTSTEAGAAASAVESPSSLSDTATGFSHVVIDIDELEKSDDSGGDSSSEHDGGQFDAAEEAQEGDTEDEDAEQPDLLEIQRAI